MTAALVAVVHKPAVEAQLAAMIAKFQPRKVVLLLHTAGQRIDEVTVREWTCIRQYRGELELPAFSFDGLTAGRLKQQLSAIEPLTHVAVPIFVGSSFWGVVPWLRRRGITVVNISDGTVENTTILDSFLRLKLRFSDPFRIVKSLILPPTIRLIGRADLTFHPFWPTYSSCFSRRSEAEAPWVLSDAKRPLVDAILRDQAPQDLVIGGYEWPAARIAQEIGSESWVATSKGKELIVNGQAHPLPWFLCAQELLSVFRPTRVVGYSSDALAVARHFYPDVPCIAIHSEGAKAEWGTLHNRMYEVQNRKLGIRFVQDLRSLASP
jgi:hypothetical protein